MGRPEMEYWVELFETEGVIDKVKEMNEKKVVK